MRTFFDSSAFAKRYVEEPGSEVVEELCMGASQLALSAVCIPEIISALNRRRRERQLSRQDYAAAKQRLLGDVRDVEIVNLTPAVLSVCTEVLEASAVRAMDALHVACAARWGAELFVSSDRRQLAAARKAALPTRAV